jgi:adenylate cyclase
MDRAKRVSTPLLIVFMDFTRFTAEAQRVEDAEMAEIINESYQHIGEAIEGSGGTVVKFIGDATLAVYAPENADAGVRAALALKPAMDGFMKERGLDCRLAVKIHCGEVIAGPFGPTGHERFDVIGRAVNTAAKLPEVGVTLTAEAFRCCSPELRKEFKKHTPPITYIRVDDPRPSSARR